MDRLDACIQRKLEPVIERAFPQTFSMELIEQWADEIPVHGENNPLDPEWKETPVKILDLSAEGYGIVHVKDESDQSSNPTRTIKDRKAWEFATLYRDLARSLYLDVKRGYRKRTDISQVMIPRMSLITAGNEGMAIATCFDHYHLPPPKLLVGNGVSERLLKTTSHLYADVYETDLSCNSFSAEDIRVLTGAEVDITSILSIDPNTTYYDWHVHEAFNQKPDEIYLPYGVGHLRDNYISWQRRTTIAAMSGKRDPRLKIDPLHVEHINILAAEPESVDSIADKLACRYKPFTFLKENDLAASHAFNVTGSQSGKYPVSDERIRQAFMMMLAHGIDTEPSAAAGFALYLDRFDQGLVRDDAKVLIVNTGKGI